MIAPEGRANQWAPGRLRSLWDMLEIQAEPFVSAVQALSWMATIIRSHEHRNPNAGMAVIERGTKPSLRKSLRQMEAACDAFAAHSARREIAFALRELRDPEVTFGRFKSLIEGLDRLFRGEIENAKLFALDANKAPFYGTAAGVFGMAAVVAFPAAEFDLEEAAKCLAVSRNTASVYHLMRAMEIVVLAAGKRLGCRIADKDDRSLEWGKVIGNIGAAIEAMPKGEERSKWHHAHALLYHVKEAWRNPTMHPSQKYTDEEAREVLAAVKAFIRSLATLAPDPGGVFD